MHDAAFKRLFCHPVAIEILVREYAPKRAERIDFSTLEKLDAELVGEALVRRYPDMIWMARTRDGAGHVVILMEFQGARDRLMSLRVAVYALLTVQELLRRMRLSRTPHSLEVLSFVIYHGKGRWTAPTRLGGLFSHWVPGDYRVIPRQSDQGGSGTTRGDLSRAILALERDRSVEGTRATLRALTRIAEETGGEYASLMAKCVGEMLVSSNRITREQMEEVRTMAQVETEYERSLEEWGKRWFRQGRDEGIRVGRLGQAEMLSRQVRKKFGPEAAEKLSVLLGDTSGSGRLSQAAIAVIECATAEEFLSRVRQISRA